MIRVVNKYSAHSRKGDHAAEEFYKKTAPEFGIEFELIEARGKGNHPDAWVCHRGKRIALAEVKMIEYQQLLIGGVGVVKTHKTIFEQIRKAKKQLRARDTELPKVLYIICDASFTDDDVIAWAIYGPIITVVSQEGQVKYHGHRGLCRERRKPQDDKFKDRLLSAIICIRDHDTKRTYSVFRNMASVALPDVLVPRNAQIYPYWGEMVPPPVRSPM